jgi:hypothetical protein
MTMNNLVLEQCTATVFCVNKASKQAVQVPAGVGALNEAAGIRKSYKSSFCLTERWEGNRK